MILRTKSEQKAYLDGFEMCAKCIENYLSNKGKKMLECLLISVRNAVDIEDIVELKGNKCDNNHDCEHCDWVECPEMKGE